eukprot:TRINITY_DN7940_c3_g1_i1.p1 TRINITY_DN7940_c3_g1~~TRINITY_DN7940_c3_g1_i1.p1  ORF type:complete len:181 (+),score=5.58 TRINITY_DN7940_c3_g1_i1:485-1027(+)
MKITSAQAQSNQSPQFFCVNVKQHFGTFVSKQYNFFVQQEISLLDELIVLAYKRFANFNFLNKISQFFVHSVFCAPLFWAIFLRFSLKKFDGAKDKAQILSHFFFLWTRKLNLIFVQKRFIEKISVSKQLLVVGGVNFYEHSKCEYKLSGSSCQKSYQATLVLDIFEIGLVFFGFFNFIL